VFADTVTDRVTPDAPQNVAIRQLQKIQRRNLRAKQVQFSTDRGVKSFDLNRLFLS
jgi:hypothetical protein